MPPNLRSASLLAALTVLLASPLGCGSTQPRASIEPPRPDQGVSAAPKPAATADAADETLALGDGETDGLHDDDGEPHDDIDDSDEPEAPEVPSVRPHPLDGWSDAKIEAAVRSDLASLGSMSLGTPNAGALLNGVQAVETPYYKPVSPSGAWSTQETLTYLDAAIKKVHDAFPDTPPLALGDISGRRGGHSPPHISHQAGRDVDISYYYNDGARWYARGTAKNLDLPRNWALVRALITETDVDLILIDHSIQALLERYALEQGEDAAWLAGVFRGVPGRLRPIIRHAPGHATHIHIRFFNPTAQETARRCHAALLAAKLTTAPQSFISHKVKKNETLGMISRKYGVSVPRLRAANRLKSSLIRAKSVLRVPVASRGPVSTARLKVPARRLPPPPKPLATASGGPQPPPTK